MVAAASPTGRSSRSSLGLIGACAVVTIAALIAKSDLFRPLRYCGQNSIVIYLAFFLPMAATRIVLLKTGILTDLGTVSVLVTALPACIGALALVLGGAEHAFRFLFERPAWARLKPARRLGFAAGGIIHSVPRLHKFKTADGPHSGHANPLKIQVHRGKARRRRAGRQEIGRGGGSLKTGDHLLPRRRLGLHLPRLSRAAAADASGRPAGRRGLRLHATCCGSSRDLNQADGPTHLAVIFDAVGAARSATSCTTSTRRTGRRRPRISSRNSR